MSAVAIPFKDEPPDLVARNVEIAASHRRIERVWAIGDSGETGENVAARTAGADADVSIVPQRRLGSFRPGKGDAMNTALELAAAEGVDRLHFYDADITNFDHGWIDGAESAADLGYETVRHTFPRAATDAMITWLITKPVLAIRYPGTILPRIGQPLGGELLLGGPAITALANSEMVRERSDWGIDTVLTFGMVASGFSMYEHHVASGKQHSLYGSLEELRTMLVECFEAARALPAGPVPEITHHRDPDAAVPESLKRASGYDVSRTAPILTRPVDAAERDALGALSGALKEVHSRLVDSGDPSGLDAEAWGEFLECALDSYQPGEAGWEGLLFRMWTARVLSYTSNQAVRGYEEAMSYLAGTIERYQRR